MQAASTMAEFFTSRQVAEMVGISYSRFLHIMREVGCPVPESRAGNSLVWTPADVKRLRRWLDGRPGPGRPKKSDDEDGEPADE